MSTKRSYLITGGLGFIGSALANAVEGRVTVVARSIRHQERLQRDDTTLILKDIRELVCEDFVGVDIVYHCASTVHNYHVYDGPYIDMHTNIEGTIHLLELCKDLPKKPTIVYLSTFFVYGDEYDRTNVAINEESRTNPLGLYSATKLCAESIIRLYAKLHHIPYLICRLTNVYGETEVWNDKKKGALNSLVMSMVRGESINLYRDGNFYRDYIHVDDVVSALLFLEQRAKNDLFLIGYGAPVKFRYMIEHVLERTGRRSSVMSVEPPSFHQVVGITNFVADTQKISSLGWYPKIGYHEGLDRIIDRYRTLV